MKNQQDIVSHVAMTTSEKVKLSLRCGERPAIYFPNGDIYIGEWKDDKQHGNGVYYYGRLLSKYEGEFNCGKRHGRGVLSVVETTAKQEEHLKSTSFQPEKDDPSRHRNQKDLSNIQRRVLYVGEWRDDRYHGTGKLCSLVNENSFYEGTFANGLMHGNGKLIYENGDIYEGEWFAGKRHGSGKLQLANGDYYNGRFEDNVKHGAGRFYFRSKQMVYIGEWVDDAAVHGSMLSDNDRLPRLELRDPDTVLQKQSTTLTDRANRTRIETNRATPDALKNLEK